MNHFSPWETPFHQFQAPQVPVQMFDPSKFQPGVVYGMPEVRYLDGGNYQNEAKGLQPHFFNPWSVQQPQQQQQQANEWSNAPAVIAHLSYGNSEYEWPPTTDNYSESGANSDLSLWYRGNFDGWQQPQQHYCQQNRGYVESMVGEQQLYYDGQTSSESLSRVQNFPGNNSFPVDPLVSLDFSGGKNMDHLSLEQGKAIQQPEPQFEMIPSCGPSTDVCSLSNFENNDGQVPDQQCISTNAKLDKSLRASSSLSKLSHLPSSFGEISGFVSGDLGKDKSDGLTSLTPALHSGQNLDWGARFILASSERIPCIGGKNISPPLTGKVQYSEEESFVDQSMFGQHVDCGDTASSSTPRNDLHPCLPLEESTVFPPRLAAGPGTTAGITGHDQFRKVPELRPSLLQDVGHIPSVNPNNESHNILPAVQCTDYDGASTEGISGTLLDVDSNQACSSGEANAVDRYHEPVSIEPYLYQSAETAGQDQQTNIYAMPDSARPDSRFVPVDPRSLHDETVAKGSVDVENFIHEEFKDQFYVGEVSLPSQQQPKDVSKSGFSGDGLDFHDISSSFSPRPLEQQRSPHDRETHESKRLELRERSDDIPDHLLPVLPNLHRKKAMSPVATLCEDLDPLVAGTGVCLFPAPAVKEPQPGHHMPAEHGRHGSGGLEVLHSADGFFDLPQNTGTGPFKNTNFIEPTHSDCEESVLLGNYKGSGDQTSEMGLNSRLQTVNKQTRDPLVFHRQELADVDKGDWIDIQLQGAALISTGALLHHTVTPIEAEAIPHTIAHIRNESADSLAEDMINCEKESALVTKNLEWKTTTECQAEMHSETMSHTRHLGSEDSPHPKSERIVTQELDPAGLFKEAEKNLFTFDENQLQSPTSSKKENLINPNQKHKEFNKGNGTKDNISDIIRQAAMHPNEISCQGNSSANRKIDEQDNTSANMRMDEQDIISSARRLDEKSLERNYLPSDDHCGVQYFNEKSTSKVESSSAHYRETVADRPRNPQNRQRPTQDEYEESRSMQEHALDPPVRPQSCQGCTDDSYASQCSRQGYPENLNGRPKYRQGCPDELFDRPGSQQGCPDYDHSRSKPSSRQNYPSKYKSHSRQGCHADNQSRPREDCSDDVFNKTQGSHQDYPVDEHDQRRPKEGHPSDCYDRPKSKQGYFETCSDNPQGRSQYRQDSVKTRKQEHDFGDSYKHGIYDHSHNDSRSKSGYQDRNDYKVHQGYSDETYERSRSSDHDRSHYRSERCNDRMASELCHRDRGDREHYGYEDYYREYYNRYIALQYAYQHGGYQHYYPFQYPYQDNKGYVEEMAHYGQIPMHDPKLARGKSGRTRSGSHHSSTRGSSPSQNPLSSAVGNFARRSHRDHSFSVTELPSLDVELEPNVAQSFGYQDQISYKGFRCRMTPMKFIVPHVRTSFGPPGRLVHVLPNSPADGHPGVVQLIEVNDLFIRSPEADQLRKFPGPLIRHETHKNDVLLYCQKMALECRNDVNLVDRESAQLIWRYLELLIRQNGTVIGTDVASLLLEGEHEPTSGAYEMSDLRVECSREGDGISEDGSLSLIGEDRTVINKSSIGIGLDESADNRFRHLLLHGRKKDALEWAMRRNLWGHALFLASKMDSKTNANVMTQFVNASIKMNDPLQTLYQIMSGRQPAAVTLIGDDKYGDWRPHLSIILSNPTQRTELDRKSIVALGDTLASRGLFFASQFCYIVARVPFGCYHKKSSKIVLLGAAHSCQFEEFATTSAIQCTETYEYGLSLANPNLILQECLVYKFIYVLRLIDYGFLEEALKYTEVLSGIIVQSPGVYPPALIRALYSLSYGLLLCDPQVLLMDEAEEVTWFQNLQQAARELKVSLDSDEPLYNFS